MEVVPKQPPATVPAERRAHVTDADDGDHRSE